MQISVIILMSHMRGFMLHNRVNRRFCHCCLYPREFEQMLRLALACAVLVCKETPER